MEKLHDEGWSTENFSLTRATIFVNDGQKGLHLPNAGLILRFVMGAWFECKQRYTYGLWYRYRWSCIKLRHASGFSIRAMNDLASDSVPFAARGFLLALVACLHVAGAAALSSLSGSSRHDEVPVILRASWIEHASPAPSPPAVQPAEPRPVTRQPRPRRPTPLRPVAVRSVPALANAVSVSPMDLAVQDDPVSASSVDATVTVATAATGGTVDRDGESGEMGDYVGPSFNASYFSNPEPDYPSQSRRLREQGLVKLRVYVTIEGRAGELALYKSSGYERLDKAALDAVRRWRFRPAQRAGMPVAGWVVVPIRFELQS